MKLITINIEGDLHFDSVIPFIKAELPDILCIQEIFKIDLCQLEELGYSCTFLPMTMKLTRGKYYEWGTALCSQAKPTKTRTFYYPTPCNEIPVFNHHDIENSVLHGVIESCIPIGGDNFRIATTHFTWTPDGAVPSTKQKTDIVTLLAYLAQLEPHVLCGDFNIPRSCSPLYAELTKHYTDTIPESYVSSLDAKVHRHGKTLGKERIFNSFMVDYIFTQPPYKATDVRLGFGLSDHAAVVATIL
ncbi:MAG: hypothetical protein K9M10_03905 [Candidatus Pacebacteria bacterium]|nr:hypothetical protein [Candidatus Paceibacterota bacterium]MCF7857594.1 hypothetical protein [Candidatus Paceibacterota bacterium]